MSLNHQDIINIADNISYLDWKLYIGEKNGVPYLQWQFHAETTDTVSKLGSKFGDTLGYELQKCRKWQLSYHMIPQEIERTAFKALEAAVFHEMSENYRYKGAQIRHPHINPDALVEMMKTNPIVSREHV